MNNTKIVKIVIQGDKDSFLGDCMKEQVILSAKEQQIVELHWRASRYIINPDDLTEMVKQL